MISLNIIIDSVSPLNVREMKSRNGRGMSFRQNDVEVNHVCRGIVIWEWNRIELKIFCVSVARQLNDA